ncbi:MAG: glutamate formimidoyltransferase [Abditibacteriales bacterium]|nr:glutamate formimidoyltransferase [Abditibacteriales bacterium]MDW8365957.1 glutamate formimidoyltransferase [Abditibacteriales bacterium]
MSPLVKCVPNFSEGRRQKVLAALAEALSSVPQALLTNFSADADHNRSVFTLMGTPLAVKEAVLQGARCAVALIDLNVHRGAHPRIGAVDVVPFVPLAETTLEQCRALAHEFAEQLVAEFNVPVYFYEESAQRPERRDLAYFRQVGFEFLREHSGEELYRPDLGPTQLHPTAGATAVGARKPLVAFNVNLDTTDITIAQRIARALRERDGGLRGVKAMGVNLATRGMVQVSFNIVEPDVTPLYRVLENVRLEAARFGVAVVETEIIGTLSSQVLVDTFNYYMQLRTFETSQIDDVWIERLKTMTHDQ